MRTPTVSPTRCDSRVLSCYSLSETADGFGCGSSRRTVTLWCYSDDLPRAAYWNSSLHRVRPSIVNVCCSCSRKFMTISSLVYIASFHRSKTATYAPSARTFRTVFSATFVKQAPFLRSRHPPELNFVQIRRD